MWRDCLMPGPWDDEPDEIELWVDPETSLPCIARRNDDGRWCGYVGVPLGTLILEPRLRVHGGISGTLGIPRSGVPLAWAIALPDVDWPKTEWFGFDCGHVDDACPGEVHREGRTRVYRTLAYVREQCASLAEQLAEQLVAFDRIQRLVSA